MRKVNTIGIKQANKCMLMAAMAYNLKKYLKFTEKLQKVKAESLAFSQLVISMLLALVNSILNIKKL